MRCDPDGRVAMCDVCGQIHSAYWSANKSAGLHRKGTGHKVKVAHGLKFLKERTP